MVCLAESSIGISRLDGTNHAIGTKSCYFCLILLQCVIVMCDSFVISLWFKRFAQNNASVLRFIAYFLLRISCDQFAVAVCLAESSI